MIYAMKAERNTPDPDKLLLPTRLEENAQRSFCARLETMSPRDQADLGRLLAELNAYLLAVDQLQRGELERGCNRIRAEYLALLRAPAEHRATHHLPHD